MNTAFDFNINNYTIKDIEKFLGLNQDYTFNDVIQKKESMINIIIDNKQYDKKYITSLINFMEESVVKIAKNIKKITHQNDGFIEDYDKLLIATDEGNVVNQTSTTYAGHNFVMNKNTVELNDVLGKSNRLNPIETYQTNISRSNLNGVKRKTFNQTIMLNTLFREDYENTSSTDFNIVLPYYFKNVLSIRLSSLQLPNVMYNISAANGNNVLFIDVENGGPNGTVTMPDGNYDISSFVTTLQTQLNTQLSTANFTVTYDQYTYKITISYINPPLNPNFTMIFYTPLPKNNKSQCKIKPENKTKPDNDYRKNDCVDITQIYKNFGWFMGYRKAEYSGATSFTTEAVYNSSPYDYIYFTLNDYNMSQSQNIFGMFSKSILGDNILAVIPVTSNSFNICFDNGINLIEKKREYYGPVNIQRLKIQLLNQYGEILNLNNMDFSFSLELEIGYDW
jgi:hypothetical protein